MEQHKHELPIPGPAVGDANAIEMLRVWAASGNQHVSLNTGLWADPANWGIMLVDLARHVANAYQQTGKMESAAALLRLKKGFDAEWGSATDTPLGELIRS